MPTDTPLEMKLDALANVYNLTAEAVVEIALHNLGILAAFQMGAEGVGDAQKVFSLLLSPSLSTTAESGAPVFPDVEADAAPKNVGVIQVAAQMEHPFTSRDVKARMAGAVSSASIGMTLAKAGWPAETAKVGQERRWLPRPPA